MKKGQTKEILDNQNSVELKILKGTVVKVDGHPVQIKKSFIVEKGEADFNITEHEYIISDSDLC